MITSSCVHLNWQIPIYDGGLDITNYVVHHTTREKVITVTDRDVIDEKIHRVKTSNTDTNLIIRNLPSDSDILNIGITAVNKAGLISVQAQLPQNPVLRTMPASR